MKNLKKLTNQLLQSNVSEKRTSENKQPLEITQNNKSKNKAILTVETLGKLI